MSDRRRRRAQPLEALSVQDRAKLLTNVRVLELEGAEFVECVCRPSQDPSRRAAHAVSRSDRNIPTSTRLRPNESVHDDEVLERITPSHVWVWSKRISMPRSFG